MPVNWCSVNNLAYIITSVSTMVKNFFRKAFVYVAAIAYSVWPRLVKIAFITIMANSVVV